MTIISAFLLAKEYDIISASFRGPLSLGSQNARRKCSGRYHISSQCEFSKGRQRSKALVPGLFTAAACGFYPWQKFINYTAVSTENVTLPAGIPFSSSKKMKRSARLLCKIGLYFHWHLSCLEDSCQKFGQQPYKFHTSLHSSITSGKILCFLV